MITPSHINILNCTIIWRYHIFLSVYLMCILFLSHIFLHPLVTPNKQDTIHRWYLTWKIIQVVVATVSEYWAPLSHDHVHENEYQRLHEIHMKIGINKTRKIYHDIHKYSQHIIWDMHCYRVSLLTCHGMYVCIFSQKYIVPYYLCIFRMHVYYELFRQNTFCKYIKKAKRIHTCTYLVLEVVHST